MAFSIFICYGCCLNFRLLLLSLPSRPIKGVEKGEFVEKMEEGRGEVKTSSPLPLYIPYYT